MSAVHFWVSEQWTERRTEEATVFSSPLQNPNLPVLEALLVSSNTLDVSSLHHVLSLSLSICNFL